MALPALISAAAHSSALFRKTAKGHQVFIWE
jgi:hypothetical protein